MALQRSNVNFSSAKRYFSVFSSYRRNFCSKNNDIVPGSSSLKDDPSKEKSEKKSEDVAPNKRKFMKLKSTPITEETKKAAKQKLKSLLSNINITSEKSTTSTLNLARPLKRISKKERQAQIEAERITPEKKLDMAVKAVASAFKEDSEKIESELKEQLSAINLTPKDATDEEIKDTEDVPFVDEKLSENLMSSVEEVASTISENPIPPRSELAKRLMRLSLDQKVSSDGAKSMRSVIEGMTIKKKVKATPEILQGRIPRTRQPPARIEHVNLFGAAPLNIFDPNTEVKPESTNIFWQKLQEKELRLLTTFAPANAFEEMIRWTEQGKHWKFPIDNETEMGDEEKIGFHEHVFLEKHLKGFPTKGPIRHFMHLVCVGLSKNPYVSVERKIENIDWFRNYFKDKEELLRECGVLDD